MEQNEVIAAVILLGIFLYFFIFDVNEFDAVPGIDSFTSSFAKMNMFCIYDDCFNIWVCLFL